MSRQGKGERKELASKMEGGGERDEREGGERETVTQRGKGKRGKAAGERREEASEREP